LNGRLLAGAVRSLIARKPGQSVARRAPRRMRISNPCVAKLTLAITKFQMEQVSDGNALEQNLEVADLKTRA
jgi:hypothetical protein